jgi:hypothetical protein
MSLLGHNPNLPHCNMNGCFSSNSGHSSRTKSAAAYFK